jgi:hypothetical protein
MHTWKFPLEIYKDPYVFSAGCSRLEESNDSFHAVFLTGKELLCCLVGVHFGQEIFNKMLNFLDGYGLFNPTWALNAYQGPSCQPHSMCISIKGNSPWRRALFLTQIWTMLF